MREKTKAILLLIVLISIACNSKTPQERQQEMIKKLRTKYHKEIPDSITIQTEVVQAPCDTVFIDRVVNDTIIIRDTIKLSNPAVLPIVKRHKEVRKPKVVNPKEQYATYTVKKGDTYYSLSKRYNIPVAKLKQLNGNAIKAGQVIKLPVSN